MRVRKSVRLCCLRELTGASVSYTHLDVYKRQLSDIRVVNTWFIRFNNFSFSYDLPERWISSFAQSVIISFSATNPLQIKSKDFKGRDPEVALGKQPRPQNFSFGINVSF